MITLRSLVSARPFLVGLASCVASALGAAACGDDAETGSGGAAASSGMTSTSGTTTATTTSVASGGEGGAGGAGGTPDVCAPPAGLDDDASMPGPFEVGARTVEVEGLTVEVWYPAAQIPDDVAAKTYDIRDHLPESEVGKIADEDAPLQTCDCWDDVAIHTASGAFPVVVFVHGTAGFRSQSLEIVTHWASRGFVVLAADHPGLQLRDLLALACGQGATARDLDADLETLYQAIQEPTGDLAFLAGRIDSTRLAFSGHSAGGAAIETWGDVGQVLIPMAAGGVAENDALRSTLILSSLEDQVVASQAQQDGFASSPTSKRIVQISPAGHLIYSSLCSLKNDAGQDIVEAGTEAGVCGVNLADGLFDCSDDYMPDETGWTIIRDATSAVLEETLMCLPERGAWLADIQSRYPEIATFEEEL